MGHAECGCSKSFLEKSSKFSKLAISPCFRLQAATKMENSFLNMNALNIWRYGWNANDMSFAMLVETR